MTTAQLRKSIKAGIRKFQLNKISQKTNFYNLCSELGVDGYTSRTKNGWLAQVVINTNQSDKKSDVRSTEPEIWPTIPPIDLNNKVVKKFCKGLTNHEQFPDSWIFYSPEYHLLTKPRHSESPLSCLYNLATPITQVDLTSAMRAAQAEPFALLPWDITLARSLASIPSSNPLTVVPLAYQHLVSIDKKSKLSLEEFTELCSNEQKCCKAA